MTPNSTETTPVFMKIAVFLLVVLPSRIDYHPPYKVAQFRSDAIKEKLKTHLFKCYKACHWHAAKVCEFLSFLDFKAQYQVFRYYYYFFYFFYYCSYYKQTSNNGLLSFITFLQLWLKTKE